MYEHDRSSSKGGNGCGVAVDPVPPYGYRFDLEQRKRQARLGCAPSYQLFDLVRVEKRPEVEYPLPYRDYTGSIRLDARPAGVDVGFLCSPYGEISWESGAGRCRAIPLSRSGTVPPVLADAVWLLSPAVWPDGFGAAVDRKRRHCRRPRAARAGAYRPD